jgi:cytochrome o ubiquinol oxidase subunit 3
MVMFSALFAAYAVLRGNTAGRPTGAELFNLRNVFIETMCLLLSSYQPGSERCPPNSGSRRAS